MAGADYHPNPQTLNRIIVVGDLFAGVDFDIPFGVRPLAVYSNDADVPDLRLEISYNAVNWVVSEDYNGGDWAGVAARWVPLPEVGRCGVLIARLRNSGANAINAIYLLVTD